MLTPEAQIDSVLKIKFQCPTNEIDGDTFTNAFIGFSRIIWAVNEELDTGRKINIRIRAIESGSFIFDIQLVAGILENIKNLFAAHDPKVVAEVLAAVLGILKLVKTMQKEDDKSESSSSQLSGQSGGSATFPVNGNGNQINIDQRVINLYSNSKEVKEGIRQVAEAVINDPEVNGIELQDANKTPIFQASASEWGEILKALPSQDVPETRIISRKETLAVVKASLDPRYAWEFSFLGTKIFAKVEDTEFNTRILRREELFGAGDLLEVELDMAQTLDRRSNVYVTKQYRVSKVYSHQKGPTQNTLFNEDT
jgi:hypothetical protein